MKATYGRLILCHMIADSDDELHAMADKIGVNRKWHQAPPRHSSHYDIALSKRKLAIEAGAVEITWRQCGAMSTRRHVTGSLGPPEDAEKWSMAYREQRRAAREAERSQS